MAIRPQPPSARAAGDDPPAAAGRDDWIEQALARSREIRARGARQLQATRRRLAAVRRRPGQSAGSGLMAQDPVIRLDGTREQIERSRQARAQVAALAARLVQTEESVADVHDQMARRDPRRAAQYRQTAEEARQAARRAREIQRHAAGSDPE